MQIVFVDHTELRAAQGSEEVERGGGEARQSSQVHLEQAAETTRS